MGGSSLAPEVIAKHYQKDLTVLDSTDPAQVSAALPADLSTTVVVVGSKSGSTIETASQRAFFADRITAEGLNLKDHMVIVTDPGSPLDKESRALGLRTINADPHVGGRYSALTAFGLVPAALMGVDVSVLLDDAASASQTFSDIGSAAVEIATILFENTEEAIAFYDEGSTLPGISDWIEQLVAESTGKNEKGRMPVVIEGAHAPVGGRIFTVAFAGNSADLIVDATLGEQFILWEWVTALLSRAIYIDPFNQPNVTEAKERTGELLHSWIDGKVQSPVPAFESDAIQIFGDVRGNSVAEIVTNFLHQDNYYFAVMAYLARGGDDAILELRSLIAARSEKPTTFGWGPRFLHSTGQFHKGGQQNGAFIQISGESLNDVAIPGQKYGFHSLLMAQVLGDGQALASRKYPLIRFHLKNRQAGIHELVAAFKA
jgi:glucose-6-phosphate isomerase